MNDVKVKELSHVNDELMDLMLELKGLREMVNTVSMSINYSTVIENDREKLDRLSAPYPAIVSAINSAIQKLDGYTNDLDLIDSHTNRALRNLTSAVCDSCKYVEKAPDQKELDAECAGCPLAEYMEGRCK